MPRRRRGGERREPPAPRTDLLATLRACQADLAASGDLASLLDAALASRGYAESGVGSEVGLGEGIIGVAAAHTPIRIGYAAEEYRYSQVTRRRFAGLETEILLPGLAEAGSQLALPLTVGACLIGALYLESPQEQRFTYEDEDTLMVLAGQLALSIDLLSRAA